VRLFGLVIEEAELFISLETRTNLMKDACNCNGEELRRNDVSRWEGEDDRTSPCALLLIIKKRCDRLFSR
jgi:hypothetical protein